MDGQEGGTKRGSKEEEEGGEGLSLGGESTFLLFLKFKKRDGLAGREIGALAQFGVVGVFQTSPAKGRSSRLFPSLLPLPPLSLA